MSENPKRVTKVWFKAQDAVALYSPATSGGPNGWNPVNEADAVASPGKKGWLMWLHETSPGVGEIRITHCDRPEAVVHVPLSSVKSYESSWSEPRYKALLEREAAEAAAVKSAKLADAEKAAAKK